MKVAKLVLWSPVVRVIVEDTASDEEVANLARKKIIKVLDVEYLENIEEIKEDLEVPYNPDDDWLVGGKYEVTANVNHHEFKIGEVVELLSVDDEDGSADFLGENNKTWWLWNYEVKLKQ